MSSKSVIVIGGGLAGLSSAAALAEGGVRRRLVEKPLHMGQSFASYALLGWADKRAIAAALLAIARSGGQPADLSSGVAGENVTMLAWLKKHRQTERAIR